MWIALALLSLLLAAVPCALFLVNLRAYQPLPQNAKSTSRISVLIPARNEAARITAALASVLRSERVEMEVLVLDDHSTDDTAAIVRAIAESDPRVRLIIGQTLPAGWCGKNFACQQLAGAAQHPVLFFMDADVRASRPDALTRLAQFVEASGAALVSGVPREETRTFLEILIIPLIHFVLLGFLPLRQMRATTDPRFAAACGQILAVSRAAYHETNGHAAIAERIHDAVALCRNFRARGFRTDLFDATDTFDCRMYSSAVQVWNGFAKNAHEGLGSRALIVPATLVLLGGQVAPFVVAFTCNGVARWTAAAAIVCVFIPRVAGAIRFRQSAFSAALHPLAIIALVAIQWSALLCRTLGFQIQWKSRIAGASAPSQLV